MPLAIYKTYLSVRPLDNALSASSVRRSRVNQVRAADHGVVAKPPRDDPAQPKMAPRHRISEHANYVLKVEALYIGTENRLSRSRGRPGHPLRHDLTLLPRTSSTGSCHCAIAFRRLTDNAHERRSAPLNAGKERDFH
jgi:hypothetical protein